MKTGIICEGGGMRGVFTAGVLQAFMDAGFWADELVGVSAGASNGASYVSRQKGRGFRTNVDYTGDKRYMSLGSYLRTGSFFGMDFIFGEIPASLDPFDFETFHASPCAFFAGATDVETGRIHYFSKEEIGPGLFPIRASCSMPMLSPAVELNGRRYLDGGVAAPIPVDKGLEDGCDRLLVILTQPRGFVKQPQGMRPLYEAWFRRSPAMARAIRLRHVVYNKSLAKVAALEKAGKALVIAPPPGLELDRFGKDKDKLVEAFRQGEIAGAAGLKGL